MKVPEQNFFDNEDVKASLNQAILDVVRAAVDHRDACAKRVANETEQVEYYQNTKIDFRERKIERERFAEYCENTLRLHQRQTTALENIATLFRKCIFEGK